MKGSNIACDIIFIIGLPASGKTTLAKTYNRILIDDFNNEYQQNIIQLESLSGDIIITDPMACFSNEKTVRALFDTWLNNYTISFIAFENNPEQCIINNKLRNDRNISDNYIRHISKHYNPKSFNCEIIPVYKA